MTHEPKSAHEYFRDLQTLRQSMTINREDSEASIRLNRLRRPETRFRYFVDSNVVTAFTNPAAKINYFNPLRDWLNSRELATATATVLAEFLFSGMLPGQEPQSRPFMTPAHYGELAGMAKAVGDKARTSLKRDDSLLDADKRKRLADHQIKKDDAIRRLHELQSQFKHRDTILADRTEHLLGSLSTLLLGPEPLLNPLLEATAEARLFEVLLREDRVLPAESQRWFHSAILSPDRKSVKLWYDILHGLAGKDRVDRNLHNDALSMAQLFRLQAEAPLDIQYIFITADEILTRACDNHLRKARSRKPLLLRHPWHYIPLINLQTMSRLTAPSPDGAAESRSRTDERLVGVFKKIETALDQLLNEGDEASLQSKWPERRDELKALWSEAASIAVVLNAKILEDRQEAERELIELISTSGDFRRAALTTLDLIIHRIFTGHMRLSSQGKDAEQVVEYVQSDRAGPRAPLLFVPHIFGSFTGKLSVNEYLNRIVRGEQTVSRDLLSGGTGETHLFSACVALVRKKWVAAQFFAERALELLQQNHKEHSEIVCEARYCYAMTLRFNMSKMKDINLAKELLNSCAVEHAGTESPFLLVRSLSEAAALCGTALYKENREGKKFASLKSENRKRILNEAQQFLGRAKDGIGDISWQRRGEQWDLVLQRLGLQIYSNIASLAIYESWVLQTARLDRDAIRRDSAELHRRIGIWAKSTDSEGRSVPLPGSVEVPSSVLDAILADSRTERNRFANLALELVTEKLHDDLPDMDRLEFDFYWNGLQQLLA